MYLKTLLIGCFSLLCISSFAQSDVRSQYIDRFKDIAILEMERTGIPASIKLAQGILESNSGQSYLAVKANNHFGMKCGSQWTGKKVYKKDDDYNEKGELVESCFRGYKNAESSYIAHSEFLRDPRKQYRYGFLFKLDHTDYERWARGLREAGYATSATYHRKLIDIIERYELHLFDSMTSTEAIADVEIEEDGTHTVVVIPGVTYKNNDVEYVLATEGETITDIAVRTGITLSKLISYNENQLDRGEKLKKGTVVYLQSKRNSYRGKRKWHYVQKGETMFGISQLYGIDMDHLYDRNRMGPNDQPAVGERVKIRGSRTNSSPKLASEVGGNTVPDEPDQPEVIIPDEDNDGKLDMEEDIFDTGEEEEEPQPDKDKKPLIPLPDLGGNDKEDEVVTPPTPPITDDDFGDDNMGEDEEEVQPLPPPPPPPQPQPDTIAYHTVVKGDTLYNISRRYGLSVAELKSLNGLTSNIIGIGQRLRVK
jgi:LysM repeat protein